MSTDDPIKIALMKMTLEVGVPLAIHDIQQRGGPGQSDWDWLSAWGADFSFGSEGKGIDDVSVLLFSEGNKKGATAKWMNRLIRALALMAFVPGGVTVFGLRFEVTNGHI